MDAALPLSVPVTGARAAAYIQFTDCERADWEVPEHDLVRDVLFVCQGIDGRYIRFDPAADGYLLDRHVSIPAAPRQLLQRLCEAGWLARRLRSYLGRPPGGAASRALAAAVANEVSTYDKLLAVLEAQAQGQPPAPGTPSATSTPSSSSYLTLRRLDVWMAEPMAVLRRLAILTDATAGLQGSALASALHSHAATGDAAAAALVNRLLAAACVPLCDALVAWVTRGELGTGTEEEFFVREDPGVADEHLWRRKYSLAPGPLPPLVNQQQAEVALRVGKSLNFLRRCCGEDVSWSSDAATALGAAADAGGLVYGNTAAVEALLRTAATCVDTRLREVLFTRFRLGEHCAAIKRYLLLGQGDFITSLMDGVGGALREAATGVSAYRLASVLEAAVRASNAQFDDPDVLGRLRVKLLPHGGGETGWDVFCLEYVVTPPLTTVLTDDAMQRYLRVFSFLWRLKRVEHALSGTWGGMKPNAPAGGGALLMAALGGRSTRGMSASADESSGVAQMVVPLLRRCHTLRAEMAHFVTNLQYYTMFEVLEHSWQEFTTAMAAATDLDGVIAAHEAYLEAVIARALLGDRSSLVAQHLGALFDLMLRFASLADRLFDVARDVAAPPGTSSSSGAAGQQQLAEVGAQLDALAGEYAQLLEGFLNLLPVQRHVDLRSLLFRLDFSTYYSGTLATQFVTPTRASAVDAL